MSLAFLCKKSWHTSNLKNVEQVWIAEQKAAAESKKLGELKKQIEEERQVQELRELQAKTNIGGIKAIRKVDFLYEGPMAQSNTSTEEYLMGKSYQDNTEVDEVAELENKKTAGSLFLNKAANTANEQFRRTREDPMLDIRRKQKAAKEHILKNPVKMGKIKKALEEKKLQKLLKKDRKKAKKKALKKDKKKKKRDGGGGKDGSDNDNGKDTATSNGNADARRRSSPPPRAVIPPPRGGRVDNRPAWMTNPTKTDKAAMRNAGMEEACTDGGGSRRDRDEDRKRDQGQDQGRNGSRHPERNGDRHQERDRGGRGGGRRRSRSRSPAAGRARGRPRSRSRSRSPVRPRQQESRERRQDKRGRSSRSRSPLNDGASRKRHRGSRSRSPPAARRRTGNSRRSRSRSRQQQRRPQRRSRSRSASSSSSSSSSRSRSPAAKNTVGGDTAGQADPKGDGNGFVKKKGYGLQGGKQSSTKTGLDEAMVRKRKEQIETEKQEAAAKLAGARRTPMTEEQRLQKIKEFSSDAVTNDELRQKRMRKEHVKEKLEERLNEARRARTMQNENETSGPGAKTPAFLKKMEGEALGGESMADRVKRNRHYQQRGHEASTSFTVRD